MIVKEFLPKYPYNSIEPGQFTCTAPSNIALVKYWGKKPFQIPTNPSISFTLNNCRTTTTLGFSPKTTSGLEFEILLDGNPKPNFSPKVQQFFERILPYAPFLESYSFRIETSNTFPHSSGIASSASGMSALALCLVSLEDQLTQEFNPDHTKRKASFLARLGSGSACRSIDGGLVVWGEHPSITGSSDFEGIPFPYDVHDIFKDFQDTILLIDEGEKQVSSTVGHDLMHNNPFAAQRFEQANTHLTHLIPLLKSGNLNQFMQIVESEALSLHAMMLTSNPYFVLMKPNTLSVINAIWSYRNDTGTPVCFTLDAGANVHVLYPKAFSTEVRSFIEENLLKYCQNRRFINDEVGSGAKVIQI